MRNVIYLTIVVLIVLVFASTAIASSSSGIVPVTAYYLSSGTSSNTWAFSGSSSGNIFITSGKRNDKLFEIKLPEIEFEFPEINLPFYPNSQPKGPVIELTNLPRPNWSPSFKTSE